MEIYLAIVRSISLGRDGDITAIGVADLDSVNCNMASTLFRTARDAATRSAAPTDHAFAYALA